MKSAFDPATGQWQIAWPGRVARYDLVYQSPPSDPMQGIPLGNGDVGALAWCESSRLIFAINKCDLWDDAAYGRFHNWSPSEEENATTLRHACRLIIDFQHPVFDVFYLTKFNARLNLADARLSLDVSGPFGRATVQAYIGHGDGLLYGDVQYELAEGLAPLFLLERYGSRTFSHWYALVNRDAGIGLAGTGARAGAEGMSIWHSLSTGTFAVGCALHADAGKVSYRRMHSHCASAAPGPEAHACAWRLAVTSPMAENACERADELLTRAAETGGERLYLAHAFAWKEFWLRSLMECGNDYLDNLWALTCYYAAASQRGEYPGRFIGGLWGWARDTQQWNHYFHWNQQEIYWPLNAAGHHDLLRGYLEFRFRGLTHAREDARELYGVDGAAVTDVCDRRGYNSQSERENHTPVAQIALNFWDQYRFTCDREFLMKRALPYMLSACGFFSSLFDREEDGLYHARRGTAYEGTIPLRDGITELAMAESLLRATLEALEAAGESDGRAELWRHMLGHLAPLPMMDAPGDWIAPDEGGNVYQLGPYSGQRAVSPKVLGAGFGIGEGRLLCSRLTAHKVLPPDMDGQAVLRFMLTEHRHLFSEGLDTDAYDGLFPVAEMASVFPAGPVGLAEQGSDRFLAAVNTASLYAPECMGWDPLPIVMARLGMGEKLAGLLAPFAERWQYYCNGFGHYGPLECMYADAHLPERTTTVIDAATAGQPDAQTFEFPAYPFRHMGMESMSVLAAAMNESMLQSHEAAIRVFPAIAPGQFVRFTLHARGGFVVSAEAAGGGTLWIHVRSLNGQPCSLYNPWTQAYIAAGGEPPRATCEQIIRFPTMPGGMYLLSPDENALRSWQVTPCVPPPNEGPRRMGGAQLGLGKIY